MQFFPVKVFSGMQFKLQILSILPYQWRDHNISAAAKKWFICVTVTIWIPAVQQMHIYVSSKLRPVVSR